MCCSYDEVRLFRYSAAVHVAENYNEVGFGADDNSTIKHCIIDNFDAEISSSNCKACVNCLAMIMAEVRPLENFDNDGNVPKNRGRLYGGLKIDVFGNPRSKSSNERGFFSEHFGTNIKAI